MSPAESIFNKISKFLLVTAITVGTLYLSYLFADIIVILVVSLLLYFIFNPLIHTLESNGVTRFTSVLLLIIALGFLLFLGISFLIPKLSYQLEALSKSMNNFSVKDQLSALDEFLKKYLPFVQTDSFILKIENFLNQIFQNSLDNAASVVTSIVSIIALLIIVPFLTFFLLKDKKAISKGVLNVMPNKYFEMSYHILRKVSFQLGRFVRGWILDAFLVGILSGIGLTLIGIENSVVIGVIAGVGHLIPYFGPIIGGIPAIIISIVQFGDLSMLPAIIIVFLLVYTLDNGFIQPHVFSKSVDMHPIIIILLILIGHHVLGVFGMLLAVPTATVIKTLAKEFYFAFRNYKIFRVQ